MTEEKIITFPISVPSQLGDVHADTRLLCRSRGGAHAVARLLEPYRARRGASVRRRCEDKIGVITALQQPRLMRRQEFSLASQYYL